METEEAINKRVSVRHFLDKQITENELKTLIKAGSRAPIGMSKYQEMHITVIQDKKFLNELNVQAEKYFNQKGKRLFHGAPTGIIISGKKTNYYGMEYDNGACILENIHLMATDLGLGAVYLKGVVAFFEDNPDYLKKLNIPEGFSVLAGMAIGYPDKEYPPKEHNIEYNII